MNRRLIWFFAVLSLVVGCATKKQPVLKAEKVMEVPKEVSTSPHYTSLSFEKGETQLSKEDKVHLQDLAYKVRQSGREIDDIKIVTWADREYGMGKGELEATNSDIILARQRAESIKRYLEEDLMEDEDIDFYNMAQRPGPLSRFFKTDETKVKEAFEANRDENMLSDNRASKGLVIIEYENAKNL